ncbi:MAG: VanZ family protein [Peptococcaceae bacterium]|nr:VanZ family protein [Candidatus Syntrophopropionicum ammoniitolerans]
MTAKCSVKILTWLLVLLWMLVIFHLSAQPASHSNAQSKDLVARLVETAVKITGVDLELPEKKQLVSRINSTAREYMHGVVFLVLGLLVHRALTNRGLTKAKAAAIALAICLAYGLSDEVHQLFVPGRAFQLSDLAMDGLGSLIGIGLACLKKG